MKEKSITVRATVTRDEISGRTVAEIGQTRAHNGYRMLRRVSTESEFTNEELEHLALLAGALVKLSMTKLASGTLLL